MRFPLLCWSLGIAAVAKLCNCAELQFDDLFETPQLFADGSPIPGACSDEQHDRMVIWIEQIQRSLKRTAEDFDLREKGHAAMRTLIQTFLGMDPSPSAARKYHLKRVLQQFSDLFNDAASGHFKRRGKGLMLCDSLPMEYLAPDDPLPQDLDQDQKLLKDSHIYNAKFWYFLMPPVTSPSRNEFGERGLRKTRLFRVEKPPISKGIDQSPWPFAASEDRPNKSTFCAWDTAFSWTFFRVEYRPSEARVRRDQSLVILCPRVFSNERFPDTLNLERQAPGTQLAEMRPAWSYLLREIFTWISLRFFTQSLAMELTIPNNPKLRSSYRPSGGYTHGPVAAAMLSLYDQAENENGDTALQLQKTLSSISAENWIWLIIAHELETMGVAHQVWSTLVCVDRDSPTLSGPAVQSDEDDGQNEPKSANPRKRPAEPDSPQGGPRKKGKGRANPEPHSPQGGPRKKGKSRADPEPPLDLPDPLFDPESPSLNPYWPDGWENPYGEGTSHDPYGGVNPYGEGPSLDPYGWVNPYGEGPSQNPAVECEEGQEPSLGGFPQLPPVPEPPAPLDGSEQMLRDLFPLDWPGPETLQGWPGYEEAWPILPHPGHPPLPPAEAERMWDELFPELEGQGTVPSQNRLEESQRAWQDLFPGVSGTGQANSQGESDESDRFWSELFPELRGAKPWEAKPESFPGGLNQILDVSQEVQDYIFPPQFWPGGYGPNSPKAPNPPGSGFQRRSEDSLLLGNNVSNISVGA